MIEEAAIYLNERLTTYLPLKGKVTRDFFASIYFID
jgi:hypothetical protein